MIKHISPVFDPTNGVSVFGKDIDKLISQLPKELQSKDIVHFEIGNGGDKELWQAWDYRNRPASQKLVITLHDPPIVVAKPFEKFFPSSFPLVKALRKVLDLTIGKLVVRSTVKSADAVIILNPLAKKGVIKKFGLSQGRVHFMHHLSNLLGTPAKETEDGSLLFFGNLAKHKGIDILIKAFNSLGADQGTKLVIAGEWGDNSSYRRTVEGLASSAPNIHFTGRVTDEELLQLIGRARAVVLPYRDPGITHASGPLIASMAAGKPVLASDIPIFSGFIQPGKNGLLFEDGNSEDLKLKLLELLKSRELCQKLGSAAKDYAHKELSLYKISQELKAVYQSI